MTAIIAPEYPTVWVKREHCSDCEGSLYRLRDNTINVDRLGRHRNGGIVAHVYRCNMHWAGCGALVYVPERTLRSIAADAIGERDHGSEVQS